MWFALENMESEIQRALDTYELTLGAGRNLLCHRLPPPLETAFMARLSHSLAQTRATTASQSSLIVYGMDVSLALDWISLINSPTYTYPTRVAGGMEEATAATTE